MICFLRISNFTRTIIVRFQIKLNFTHNQIDTRICKVSYEVNENSSLGIFMNIEKLTIFKPFENFIISTRDLKKGDSRTHRNSFNAHKVLTNKTLQEKLFCFLSQNARALKLEKRYFHLFS